MEKYLNLEIAIVISVALNVILLSVSIYFIRQSRSRQRTIDALDDYIRSNIESMKLSKDLKQPRKNHEL